MKLKEIIKNRGLTYKEVAAQIGIDKYQLSKYANYVCLPTPKQVKALCNVLNCNINDIYTKNELAYKTAPKRLKGVNNDKEYYHIHARVPKSRCNFLTKENLRCVGYDSLNNWVLDCMLDFECKLIRSQLVKTKEGIGQKYDKTKR